MAYTKILVIHNRLDKCVGYTQNPDKTSLEAAIDYALDRAKTERVCYETAINCSRDRVYRDMLDTKRRWGKESRKRKGYHIIQSFAPGEVTPDQAHAIGVELTQRLLGDRYEAVVSTHLNKAHLHSHIVFNSVSFVDGAMYRDQIKDYYEGIRGTSDAICREHGLSVIEPGEPLKGAPVSRGEWEAQRRGRPTVRGLVRQDGGSDPSVIHLQIFSGPASANGVSGQVRPQGEAHCRPAPRRERVSPAGQPGRGIRGSGHSGPACRRPLRRCPAASRTGCQPSRFPSAGAGETVPAAGPPAPPPPEIHGLPALISEVSLSAQSPACAPPEKPGGVFHAGRAAEAGPLPGAIPLPLSEPHRDGRPALHAVRRHSGGYRRLGRAAQGTVPAETAGRWRSPDGDCADHHTPAGAAPGSEAVRPH